MSEAFDKYMLEMEERDKRRQAFREELTKLGCKLPEYKYSIECPFGWETLVLDCAKAMLALGWDGEIRQVKQKLGGLRFYVGACSNYVRDVEHAFEAHSFHICEECGEPGKYRGTRHYLQTLCDHCDDVANKKWGELQEKTK